MLLAAVPPSYAPEREYALRVLLEDFLGLEVAVRVEQRSDTEIRTAGPSERRLLIADALFATPEQDWLTPRSLPGPPSRLPLDERPFVGPIAPDAPVIFGTPSWREDGDSLHLGVDVLGTSFFMLTRYEELVLAAADAHGRFPAGSTYAARHGLLRRPVVNDQLELLWLALKYIAPSLERRRLEFEILPSHDVDWPRSAERTAVRALRRAAGDVVRARAPVTAVRRVAAHMSGRDDWDVNNTFDRIMDASEQRGLTSAFYFIPDHPGGTIDGDYTLDDPPIRRLIRHINERGHELGLHASYTTMAEPEQLLRELELLLHAFEREGVAQARVGGRQHFLRWRNPVTWRSWDDAGLDYDSSVGFADSIGFRAGVCLEYPVFDLERRRSLALRERPLVVMEHAAIDRLGLAGSAAAEAIGELRETCRRYRGLFTLLWHNSRLIYPRERRLYAEALGD